MGGKWLELKQSRDSHLPDVTGTLDVPSTMLGHSSSVLSFILYPKSSEVLPAPFIHTETEAEKASAHPTQVHGTQTGTSTFGLQR